MEVKKDSKNDLPPLTESNVETAYSLEELAAVAETFGTVPEAVRVALTEKKIKLATQTQTATILKSFLERNVQ